MTIFNNRHSYIILNLFKNILPNEIINIILLFLINELKYKNQWHNRMLDILSNIDKGHKLIPIHIFEISTISICEECYLSCLFNKTTYNTNFCLKCSLYNINSNSRYIDITYNQFIYSRKIYTLSKLQKQLLLTDKSLSEKIFINILGCTISKLSSFGILDEIKKLNC